MLEQVILLLYVKGNFCYLFVNVKVFKFFYLLQLNVLLFIYLFINYIYLFILFQQINQFVYMIMVKRKYFSKNIFGYYFVCIVILYQYQNLYFIFIVRYSGERCEKDIDDCQFSDSFFVFCQNGGQCRDYNGGYQCFCLFYIGYIGIRLVFFEF